jgi:apolipoprotein N-acyltransferase
LLLIIYKTLYLIAFVFGARYIMTRSKGIFMAFLLPSFWVILEYIRGTGNLGFPWVPLWYSQIKNLLITKWISVFGPYGLSFIIFATGSLIYLSLKGKKQYLIAALLIPTILIVSSSLLPGVKRKGSIRVAIFQPNVLPRYIGEDDWEPLKKKYLEFSAKLKKKVDLIVLPESSLPGFYMASQRMRNLIKTITTENSSSLLLGSSDYEREGEGFKYFNTAFLIDSMGNIMGRYRKVHLVPFGEWLPYEDKIPFLRNIELGQGNYTPGKDLTPLPLDDIRLGMLICFESIFPSIAREEVRRGADLLVNITSDGWFGRSLGPVEHFELARFRAIEVGRAIVRCARTGISAIVDANGRVIESIPLFKEGMIVSDAPLYSGRTLYTIFGDWIVLLSLLNLLSFGVYNALKRKPRE